MIGRAGVATVAVVLATLSAAPPAAQAGGRGPLLQLVRQNFTVAADGTLAITVRLPTMSPDEAAAADVVVTVYGRVDTVDEVGKAIGGELPRLIIDQVDTPVLAALPAGDGEVTLSMPIETNRRTPEGLQLSAEGMYPLVVDVRTGGDPLAEVVTFVNRLPVHPPDIYETLPVGLAMDVSATAEVDTGGNLVLTDELATQLTALAGALDASTVPATVHVPAYAVSALRQRDGATADRLVSELARSTLISSPSLPLDPTTAARSDLADVYNRWLRDGEDVLYGETGVRTTRRVALVDAPLSAAGASLVRDAGAQALVLTMDIAGALHRSPGRLDTTRSVAVAVAGGAELDGVLVDPTLAELLDHPAGTPALTAIYAVADLLAMRMQILDDDGSPQRRGVLLGLPDLGIPDAAVLNEVTTLIDATRELRAASVDDIIATIGRQSNADEDVTLELPATVDGPDLTDRTELAAALRSESDSTGSMLPADDPRHAQWTARIDRLPTTGLQDAQVQSIADGIRAELEALRNAVHLPAPFKFSLTGRRSTIRFNVQNDSATALTVRLRMTSPKLTFPDGEQLIQLAPNASTQVAVPVEARTSGEYGVSLDVLPPLGNTPLAPTVPLTASLTTISGLGNFITGAALLILLTWWVRHWRLARRRKLEQQVAARHPSAGEPGGTGSLDAAASTLPPS